MLFRNLRFFEFTGKSRPRTARLVEQLSATAYVPCRPPQAASVGWVVPDGSDDGNLVLELGDAQLCCLLVEQRNVPASVVREEVMRRARERQVAGGRTPGRKELAELREIVTAELRPRVFSRLRRHPLLLDASAGLVLTNATSATAAETLFDATRTALGSLPFRLPVTGKPVSHTMTRWLRGGRLPKPFALGMTAVMRDPRNRQRVIRVRGADDLAVEVAVHLDSGYEVSELELVWADRLRFRLAEDMALKGITLLEDDEDAAADNEADAASEFAAATLVETAALVLAVTQLQAALGVQQQ
jgi:recombination associated protein RdgC